MFKVMASSLFRRQIVKYHSVVGRAERLSLVKTRTERAAAWGYILLSIRIKHTPGASLATCYWSLSQNDISVVLMVCHPQSNLSSLGRLGNFTAHPSEGEAPYLVCVRARARPYLYAIMPIRKRGVVFSAPLHGPHAMEFSTFPPRDGAFIVRFGTEGSKPS